ncbi:uncharacterized protein LOC123225202 isoform X2 [Mangifera indica]|uniref:uncharacterized protein LOC123225202 isoform X2 n=1 Tax=Mangifera indica TaxID=29780 RepID=UPI001CFB4E2B|nr:uncharacterized protein LOC123225202 isoform X2 [Mangifera indica]
MMRKKTAPETEKNSKLTFEVGWRSSKQSRRPMKKLLAEEMSRETQSKRRSPGVIARLMGLDGLPPQQSAHKQQKRSLETYQPRTASVERAQRIGASSSRLSFRKSSKDEQEFKDVFEVLDASKMESSNNKLPETSKTKFTDAEMVFIKQKFMDAKRLSTDERLQDSKEFHDALEVLDNNKDLLLKFLQQPDSLFTKHVNDLGAPPQSHCVHMSTLTLSNARKCESSVISRKAEREAPRKSHCKSTQKHLDGIPSHTYSRNSGQSFNKSPKVQLEGKEDATVFPTRIVVLKPNLGKLQTAIRRVSSPHSSHAYPSECRKHAEFPGTNNREVESWAERDINDVGFSRHNCKESREIAKEITRNMRNSFSNGSMNFSISGFKGYAGDESSNNMSGSESANDSKFKIVTYRDEFKRHKRSRSSSSRSAESSVCREARKRLSERWMMSHKSQDLGVISRGSTLGEMLAIPDGEVRPADLDAMVGEEGSTDTFCSGNGPEILFEPLGISSRDGWKDDGVGILSRSRSLPASSTFRSPKASMQHDTLNDDRYMMSKETVKRERSKAGKGNLNQKDCSSGRTSRSSSKKSSRCTSRESYHNSPDISFNYHQFDSHFKQVHPYEESFMMSETNESVNDTNSVAENVLDVGHENTSISSSESPNSELSAPLMLKGNSSTVDLDVLSSKEPSDAPSKEVPLHHPHPVSGVESPASSKEADQPSPVSILEAPFADDMSCGSEYFGGVSADLHGLRMQLQLLKLESDGYEEGHMLISSDEEEKCVQIMDDKSIRKAEDNWESSYVADLLIESGFNGVNSDTFIAACHSTESPVSPSVFEELEKKYGSLTCWTKSERKLMFDIINEKLMEIHQQCTDPRPWMRPEWKKTELQERVHKFVSNQKNNVNKDAGDKVLARESQWLDIGDYVDAIGKEIEKVLVDELIGEVVAI